MAMRPNTTKRICCNGRAWFLFLITMGFAMAIASPGLDSAYAGEVVIIQAKIKHHGISNHVLPAPDEQGHVLGIGQRVGEVDFGGKETAKYESTTMVDAWVGKRGVYRGYTKYTFKDGSEIHMSWTAESARNEANLPSQQGGGKIINGTGRFKGIEGQAVFKATQIKPTEEDSSRAAMADAVLIYTLP
jgi:hypothetical protein